MVKRILVALDPDPDTQTAIRYAIDIASRFNAQLTGLAVVDTKDIEKEAVGAGIGSLYYAERLKERLSDEARKIARELIQQFQQLVDKYCQVCHSEIIEEGVPAQRIVEDTKYHDLLIMGKSMHFFYNFPKRETGSASRIIKHSACPALLVGKEEREINKVVVAYDGSTAAASAMHHFAQIKPFGADFELEVVHVRKGDSEAERAESELLLRLAAEYLKAHGFQPQTTSIMGENPRQRLLEYLDTMQTDLVIAGAHGETKFMEIILGETAYSLIDSIDIPLFISR